jgi:putative transcriptional regulator
MSEEIDHAVEIHLDRLLAERDMTLAELSQRVGVTVANLSILKNGRAKAIRFSTLTRLCHELGCQPGDLISVRERGPVALPRHTAHDPSSPTSGSR